MNEIKAFFKALRDDPKAKALLKEMKEPAEAEEAAAAYSAIAEKLGLSLPEDQLRAFLSSRESRCRELAEQAEKKALDEEAMDQVAGGADHNECDTTFTDNEWCWFSDYCSVVINGYDAPSGAQNIMNEENCEGNRYGTEQEEFFYTPVDDDDSAPTKGPWSEWKD